MEETESEVGGFGKTEKGGKKTAEEKQWNRTVMRIASRNF